ncbi:hypothetical protein QA648_28365 (plasmid) [Rhizobium sp. CB3171]|uniref:hypothetical protein n=1 Tax=Rhizobium sp. CB3171 TaxID=3039157 RepID=UPI0024B1EE27|nr:hypothetical protein [Rhizobium sp. CB3171]WFU04549.1 hypothetical protein QA648_27610 [Rhizobium sp. CB3171]WFU04683.1 hypothetical protein QA648_28365 [Rhizobium sp. CB3171]
MRPEHFIKQHMLNRRNGVEVDFSVPETTVWANPTLPPRYGPVLPSLGNRKPSPKSPLNYRGNQPNLDGERMMYFESSVEQKAGRIFRASPDVKELREQWPTVEYVGADGQRHKHTFDYWVRRPNGKRVAIAAKPFEKLVRLGTLRILRQIKRMGIPEYADSISVVTESFANDDDDANAGWILVSREKYNEDEYLAARALVASITGAVRFWDLLRGAPIPGHRRTAIWNLIDEGLLRPLEPGRITDVSLLVSGKN